MRSEPGPGLEVRPGGAGDAEPVAALFTATRLAAVPSMPPPVHSVEEVRADVLTRLEAGAELWVAEEAGLLVGYLLLEGEWLHSLYVALDHQRQGIGSALLELAKTRSPEGLGLWVFESNAAARGLYERHGFVAVERTDGLDNAEQSPDVRLVWPDPLTRLRRRIDAIDAQLAGLLAERAAVTATIQAHKAVPGAAGRDPEREAEIARRMAALAPALGEDRLRRIMDAVITESLDAAGDGSDDSHPTGAGDPPPD